MVNLSDGNLSDSITINLTITQVNDLPSDLNASGNLSVLENESVGTQVGVFSATDADSNATHTFTLYDSNASTANSHFTMESNGTLLTASEFDHETNASFLIRVRVTDDQGGILDREFTVSVMDENESPVITQGAGPLLSLIHI